MPTLQSKTTSTLSGDIPPVVSGEILSFQKLRKIDS